MIVGCYSLDLYCDCENPEHKHRDFPQTFTHELGSKCRKAARKQGWKLDVRNSIAICPKCAKAGISSEVRPANQDEN